MLTNQNTLWVYRCRSTDSCNACRKYDRKVFHENDAQNYRYTPIADVIMN